MPLPALRDLVIYLEQDYSSSGLAILVTVDHPLQLVSLSCYDLNGVSYEIIEIDKCLYKKYHIDNKVKLITYSMPNDR